MRWTIVLSLSVLAAGCAVDPPDGLTNIPQHPTADVCSGGTWHCLALLRTDTGTDEQPLIAAPAGFGPTELASAYGLDTSRNPGATIAIVDAYDYPNAESDLAAYRSAYGLPPCTIASGCLQRVNQDGQAAPLPGAAPAGDDWTVEAALDLDMASAACPSCKLILVEANDDQSDGLFVAQNGAASLGPTVISNSWGGPESAEAGYEADFDHPGIGIFASSGDYGYDNGGSGPLYPSTSAHVTAVGGTSLVTASNARGWSEGAWSSAGSSCSAAIAKPSYQTSGACADRMAADVSAVADPNTGLAVYNAANGGWIVVGGTSAASPLVAAVYALYGLGDQPPGWAYANPSKFFDVATGSNGSCGTELCNAATGWDGPTGIGTPNGAALAGPGGGGDFTETLSDTAITLTPGGSQTITITTAAAGGGAASISLHVPTLPTGVTATFGQTTITAGDSTTLTLAASSSAPDVSAAAIRVYAQSSDHTHYRSASITVASGTGTGDFSVGLSTSQIVLSPGGSQTITVSTGVTSGSPETIDLSATSLPAGVTASFGATTLTAGDSTTLTLSASASAPAVSKDYIRIYARSADHTHYKIGYVTVN